MLSSTHCEDSCFNYYLTVKGVCVRIDSKDI